MVVPPLSSTRRQLAAFDFDGPAFAAALASFLGLTQPEAVAISAATPSSNYTFDNIVNVMFTVMTASRADAVNIREAMLAADLAELSAALGYEVAAAPTVFVLATPSPPPGSSPQPLGPTSSAEGADVADKSTSGDEAAEEEITGVPRAASDLLVLVGGGVGGGALCCCAMAGAMLVLRRRRRRLAAQTSPCCEPPQEEGDTGPPVAISRRSGRLCATSPRSDGTTTSAAIIR